MLFWCTKTLGYKAKVSFYVVHLYLNIILIHKQEDKFRYNKDIYY